MKIILNTFKMKGIYIFGLIILQSCLLLAQNPGDVDPDFNIIGGFGAPGSNNAFVYSLALQPDGKILVGGNFHSYNGTTSSGIARLTTEGNYDTSFDVGTGFDPAIRRIKLLDDGKMIVTGGFTSYNGTPVSCIIKLNSDGSIDSTFDSGSGFGLSIGALYTNGIDIQPDGKVIVSGNFETYNGIAVGRVVRLFPDGSLDTSFQAASFSGNRVLKQVAIQDDGKIMIGGSFTYFVPNDERYNIVRLLPNGSFDPSFVVGEGFSQLSGSNGINSILVLPDDQLLIGGVFSAYDGIDVMAIVRLNLDGTIDPTFNQMNQPNFISVQNLTLQDDNKILVNGGFSEYDGIAYNNFVRLDSNGFVDSSFTIGSGFSGFTYDTIVQPDSKLVIGGSFIVYNGQGYKGIVRLFGTTILNVDEFVNDKIQMYPNPVMGTLYFDQPLTDVKIYDFLGRSIFKSENSLDQIDVSVFQSGSYILKATALGQQELQAKFIKN